MFIANRPGAVRPGSSGQVIPGFEARIVDDDDRPVPIGEMGNLLIKGDSTCAYYWNQHEKTKRTIQGEWIRTGDRYTQDADGISGTPAAPTTCSSPAAFSSARSRSKAR